MITILGSGGHGWQSLSQFITSNSQDYANFGHSLEFNFVVATTDWGKTDFGGFNGTWGRILEFFEDEFGKTNNQILHPILTKSNNFKENELEYEFLILPFGDVNKIVGYFWLQGLQIDSKTNSTNLEINQKEKTEINLDLRSDNLEVLLNLWHRINHTIESNFAEEFEIYLQKALQIYQKARDKLDLKARNPSLLHFWHTFLMYKSTLIYFETWHKNSNLNSNLNSILQTNFETNSQNNLHDNLQSKNNISEKSELQNSLENAEIFAKINQIFNKLCHSFRILPRNIWVNFGDFERRVLVGSDGELTIIGEENLDEWHKPILPKSLVIKTKNLENPPVYKPLLKDLENSGLIIIPTGSVANWLGFVNNSQVLQILKQKNSENKLVWIQNNEQNTQEFATEVYQEYLENLKLKPIIIKTKNLAKSEICEFVAQKLEEIIKN